MTDQFIRFSVDGRIARIHLDRAAEQNRLTHSMTAELVASLMTASESEADVLSITAAGSDFSHGREYYEQLPAHISRGESMRMIVDANRALAAFRGISVVAIQGRALGFACGLAVQCDLSLAAETATFGFDEMRHGRPPRFVMSYLADHIGYKRAFDLVVTGRLINALDAERFGIVSRVVPERDLSVCTESLISELLELDRDALLACKSYSQEIRRIPPHERAEYAYALTVGRNWPSGRTAAEDGAQTAE